MAQPDSSFEELRRAILYIQAESGEGSMKKEKKKNRLQSVVMFLAFALLGGVCGLAMAPILDSLNLPGGIVMIMAVLMVTVFLAVTVQIIIHEAGHLVFGLLTGYKFSSFRIFSFMWIRQEGKIRFKRFSLTGTGGQCLLAPPPMVNGSFPVALYNLGGPLFNAISAVLFFVGALLGRNHPVVYASCTVLAITGLVLALTNGIPMRSGTVDNDGRNALSLRKNPEALRAFWIQMKISEQTAKGVRLKDMPEEWFQVPADDRLDNSMISALGVFAANRLMDEHRLEEADQLMAHLLDAAPGMIEMYRFLLINDRIYCELLGENRRDVIEGFLTKKQCKLTKAMGNSPTVIRTQYACALLSEHNEKQAEAIKQQFRKLEKTYPYSTDLEAERELMELAAQH